MKTTKQIPHKCPVCNGVGKVPIGYYNANQRFSTTSSATPETCKSCSGKGIVYVTEITEQ